MDSPAVVRMQILIEGWEAAADQRTIFLSCYLLMTRNILSAIDRQEFHDPAWVGTLLERFADYYFAALEAYDRDPTAAPAVWQLAHGITTEPHLLALQKLLVGINAHINYDLVLALFDLLSPEWDILSDSQRAGRYQDHCHVNAVIGRTIDAVQDQVLDPVMPSMVFIDKLLGPVDELLVSRLIGRWREVVWRNATRLLQTGEASERARLIGEIERAALRLGNLMV